MESKPGGSKITMKKIATLLSVGVIALAAVAADPSKSQIVQMRLVLDKPSTDSEQMVLVHKNGENSTNEPLPVQKRTLLDQTALKSAKVIIDPLGHPEIEIKFTKAGQKQFAELTRKNIDKRLAIVIDGRVYSAPIIRSEVAGGIAKIAGSFSKQEAEQLASKVRESLAKR
jgi:preprotein translocase subunit SecD